MMHIALIWLALLQADKPNGFRLTERVEIELPDGDRSSYENRIWIGQNRVRSDRLDLNTTVIYDLDLHIFYVIEHDDKTYQISRATLPKDDVRLSLLGLASISNGTLERKSQIAQPTGNRKQIGSFVCTEYVLAYPEQYGVETHIWSAFHRGMGKSYVRKMWYAAAGTSPPGDVRHVFNEILRNIRGIPIQIETTVRLEESEIKTTSTVTDIEPFTQDELEFMSIPKGYTIKSRP